MVKFVGSGLTAVAQMGKTAEFWCRSMFLRLPLIIHNFLFVTWLTFIRSGGILMLRSISRKDRLLTLPVAQC